MNLSSKQALEASTYDRGQCSVGVVHLGYGAFHRAHQAVFFDEYMHETRDLRWGIAAVNLRAAEAVSFANQTANTDGYILKSMPTQGPAIYRKIRSHIAFEDWSRDPDSAEQLLAEPTVALVTITVTESGYFMDDSGGLDITDAVLQAEKSGAKKQSIYAYLTAGLQNRMDRSGAPMTLLCCDNIRQNGKMLRANLLAYLDLVGAADLRRWVSENVTFPCSMVDRITPRATDALQGEIHALFGPGAGTPVMAEDFIQWVIEDNFAGDKPDWARVGVTLTPDVDPYEEAKIRILNGGHTCLTYLAALSGMETFDQAMRDPDLFEHFQRYESEEVLPALTLDLPFDKVEYLAQIANRFGNAAIGDTVERICADGFSKFPIFVRPTLEGCLRVGKCPQLGIRSIASWYVFCQHIVAGRLPITYTEPKWPALKPLLAPSERDRFLTSGLLWGDLPETYPAFVPTLATEIEELEKRWPV